MKKSLPFQLALPLSYAGEKGRGGCRETALLVR